MDRREKIKKELDTIKVNQIKLTAIIKLESTLTDEPTPENISEAEDALETVKSLIEQEDGTKIKENTNKILEQDDVKDFVDQLETIRGTQFDPESNFSPHMIEILEKAGIDPGYLKTIKTNVNKDILENYKKYFETIKTNIQNIGNTPKSTKTALWERAVEDLEPWVLLGKEA